MIEAGLAVHDAQAIIAASAPARALGIRRGMRRRVAQELCPELILVPADSGRDVRAFEQVVQACEDVVAELAQTRQWQEPTIKTLLNRLLNKGALGASKDGRRYLYTPRLKREDWLLRESKGLLDRLFGGRVAPLVAHFSEQRKLGKKDIAELKKLIEELEK